MAKRKSGTAVGSFHGRKVVCRVGKKKRISCHVEAKKRKFERSKSRASRVAKHKAAIRSAAYAYSNTGAAVKRVRSKRASRISSLKKLFGSYALKA